MLSQSFNYKLWADQRTLDAIERIDSAVFPDAFSFVLQQLNHMVIVEELFRSRLLGESEPHKSTNTDEVPIFSELKSRLLASGAGLRC